MLALFHLLYSLSLAYIKNPYICGKEKPKKCNLQIVRSMLLFNISCLLSNKKKYIYYKQSYNMV